jgi:peptidoglycan/xylan/chitin deacetylase (PgdA/CDA1 family)
MKKPDSYGGILILAVIVLFAFMMATVYKINQQKEQMIVPTTQKQHGFMVPPYAAQKEIYIASSKLTAAFFNQHGSSAESYGKAVKKFGSFLEEIGYKTKILPVEKIASLSSGDILFLLDTQVLSKKNREDILHFVEQGGALFFNFTSGFNDEDGNYVAEKFVEKMTGLHLSEKGFAAFKEGLSVTTKILSPFSRYIKDGKLLSVAIYDQLPIYKTTKDIEADIFACSYDQVTPPIVKGSDNQFKNDEAALLWHGYKGKGKWIYSALPSYSFYDISKNRERYKKLLAGFINYLSKDVEVQLYPYIDQKSVVFISEDTEYKFENFEHFADLSAEYKIPVTAFIVASLAVLPEHKEMMEKIAKNPYVEFASHSTTHKKIVGESEAFIKNETGGSKKRIDPLAPEPIRGFRPPREELNLLMKEELAKSGFTYVLGASDSYLYPKEDKEEKRLYYIPRHGTDDYSYLVNLDWDQKEIGRQIKEEAEFVMALNGVFTLSVHTHLFSYSSNIEIIRAFYEYLKAHPEFKPLQGRALIKRVDQHNHLVETSKIVADTLVITLENKNSQRVDNLHLQLFKNPQLKVVGGRASDGTKVTYIKSEETIVVETIPANTQVTLYVTLTK